MKAYRDVFGGKIGYIVWEMSYRTTMAKVNSTIRSGSENGVEKCRGLGGVGLSDGYHIQYTSIT